MLCVLFDKKFVNCLKIIKKNPLNQKIIHIIFISHQISQQKKDRQSIILQTIFRQKVMGFTYTVELQNIDTGEKFQHQINSLKLQELYNDKEEINYFSIVEFILLYEPQCDRDMLLIMYREKDTWVLMLPGYSLDLKKVVAEDEAHEKIKKSKIANSKIITSQSQMEFSWLNSNKQTQRLKPLLQIRFQCQLWVDENEGSYQQIFNQSYEKSMYSQRDSKSINLIQKMREVKNKISEIEKISHQLHEIQADAIGINLFWAMPYFATDGIERKYINPDLKRSQNRQERKFLKNSVKCIPYINMIAQQVKQSKKKVVLNIDQFNHESFLLRNIFNVVYLVCHTEVTQINKQDVQEKFNLDPNEIQIQIENVVSINQESSNKRSAALDNDKNKEEDFRLEDMQNVAQDECENLGEHKEGEMKRIKRVYSREYLHHEELTQIDEEKSSDNMTERKQSCDIFFSENADQSGSVPSEFVKTHSQDIGLIQSRRINNKNSLFYHEEKLQKSQLKMAFDLEEGNNLFTVYNEENYSYKKMMHEKSKPHRIRVSRSNSIKSASSKGKQKNSRSKSKKSFERESMNNIQKKLKNSHQQYDLELGNISRSKKYQKKLQKKERNKKKPAQQEKQKKKQQKKAITYFIGQNKVGELQKITPQDLDAMLKQKMLQNIELFIIHTSYPQAHLQVLKKYANNILVINSNPIFPETCTFFFLRYFFKHLFQTKNIKLAHEKALMETCYMYLNESSDFFQMRFPDLYESEKSQLEKFKFDEVMENINKKYVHIGGYLCCCYHSHEDWCIFKKNKSTSKHADAHYKFHANHCQCHFLNPMIHSCESKKQALGEYNIIDKREYYSKFVYNCCCLGVRLGKYKERRKNKECFKPFENENQKDPHEITNKFVLISAYDSSEKIRQSSLQFNTQEPEENESKKEIINFEEGTVEGVYNQNFEKSMKYLNENDLLGNSQVISELLSFFAGSNKISLKELQIKGNNDNSNERITSSMIGQSRMMTENDLNKLEQQWPWACNMYGQNSSGRKTISKYLAHLMIVKKFFEKIVIKNFSKVEELKYIEIDETLPTFYILNYKPNKKRQESKVEHLTFQKNALPPFMRCIIVTNKKIEFKFIKNISISPKPLTDEQMKIYVKLYQHLSPQQKIKLNQFGILTNLNKNSNKKQKVENEEKSMKIYANQIDSYEIISIIRRSNYQKIKSTNYLESVSKINPISLPPYIFISGVLSEALKQLRLQGGPYGKKRRQQFIQAMNKKLREFMKESKSFYILFDPKRNKKKCKKQNIQLQQSTIKESSINQLEYPIFTTMNLKQNQNQQQRQYKQQVIQLISISKFHLLLYQNFRKQISLRPLDCIKSYIKYTIIDDSHAFSLKNCLFAKGIMNLYYKNLSQNSFYYSTRKISYQNQFFQATSLNSNSLFTILLAKQMNQYAEQYDTEKIPKLLNKMSNQFKERNPLLKKPTQQQRDINQCHKQAYSEFFKVYAESFSVQNINQSSSINNRSKESGSYKQINEFQLNLTPKRQKYETLKYLKSQSLSPQQKRIQTVESKKKNEERSKQIDFEEDEKHLHIIMSAGLVYLRSTICSHVIYSLIDKTVKLQLLQSGLILINNAIILMKTPHFKHDENQSFEKQGLSDIDLVESKNQENDDVEKQETQHPLLVRNQSENKSKLSQLPLQSCEKSQSKSLKQKVQQELNTPFSIKGLLYLLFKIRERFDRLILHSNNQTKEDKDQINYVKKLSIIAQFFILQLHLMNIAKGENYEEAISTLQKQSKVQKYLSEIFYDKGRSLNYLKECLRKTNLSKFQTDIILNQVLSAYVMMITNYGRKKINENMRKEIDRFMKYDEEKTVEKQGVRKPSYSQNEKTKTQKRKNQALTPKMKILQKISQNRDIYDQMENIFSKFQCEKSNQVTQNEKRSILDSGSNNSQYGHELERSRSYYQVTLTMSQFKRQTEVYEELLGYWHTFNDSISHLKPHKLYQLLSKQRTELKNRQFVHMLRFCSRYINIFYTDLLTKIESQLKLMKDKLIIFFSADPIEGSSSSKEELPQYTESRQQNRRKVQYEGNNRTIILPTDYEMLNLARKASRPEKLQHHPSMSTNEDKTSHIQKNNQTSNTNLSQSIIPTVNEQPIINAQSLQNADQKPNPYEHFYIKKKLNEKNLNWLEQSTGCKYLCIDTTVCVDDAKNKVVGESEEGEMIIFKVPGLAEMINKISAKVIFVCLHNANLAGNMIDMDRHKEVVYFNFMKGVGTYFGENGMDRKQSSSLSSSNIGKVEVSNNLRHTYYRMIARKAIHLILEHIVNDETEEKDFLKLYHAIQNVTQNYEFIIQNEQKQIVFHLSNQDLRQTVMFYSGKKFTFEAINDKDKPIQVSEYHKRYLQIALSSQDIVSVEQVQEVKKLLQQKSTQRESKTVQQRESKTGIKIQHLNSFNKLYNIFQYYLQDKKHYELFEYVDLDEWKDHNHLPQRLRERRSQQSNFSVPETMSVEYSHDLTDKKKKQRKYRTRAQPTVRYSHIWKSQFVSDLIRKRLLNWLLSSKKCFIMFSNSDLMTDKADKHEQWARSIFQNLFKLQKCDNYQQLNRVVSEVKIVMKKSDRKVSSTASLVFMENADSGVGE